VARVIAGVEAYEQARREQEGNLRPPGPCETSVSKPGIAGGHPIRCHLKAPIEDLAPRVRTGTYNYGR